LEEGRERINDFETEEVMIIGRKEKQKVELKDLEELRNRIKEIKKRKEKIYKRFKNQSKERR